MKKEMADQLEKDMQAQREEFLNQMKKQQQELEEEKKQVEIEK
jgi:hypothetical protein